MSESSVAVKDFTEGYTGITCPGKPVLMDRENVTFLIRMVMSELCELACTVTNSEEERDQLMQNALDSRDKCTEFVWPDEIEKIGAQMDAMEDAHYYMLNVAAKHGMNLGALFKVIHEANMAKRDPATGKFIRRESDGKVIKPANWQPPNVRAEVLRQMTEGSWV